MLPEKNFNPADLRMENELKKIKMMFEHGADFFYPNDQNDLSPDVENEFLNYIEEFEVAYKKSERIPVYDFICRPAYRKWDIIPDSEIQCALNAVLGILKENQIDVTAICEVDARELYRFITEELFLHQMDDIRIKGFMTCFIYEEFHPNHEYDIKQYSADFITSFLNKSDDYYETFVSKAKETKAFLRHFRDSFDCFSLEFFDIVELNFVTEKATLKYSINFTGVIEGSSEKRIFNGEGTMEMINKNDFWMVNKISFPN